LLLALAFVPVPLRVLPFVPRLRHESSSLPPHSLGWCMGPRSYPTRQSPFILTRPLLPPASPSTSILVDLTNRSEPFVSGAAPSRLYASSGSGLGFHRPLSASVTGLVGTACER
ncbi:hypothetical protein B0H16DRAFT_1559717, partial [Mycena metata]